MSLSNKPASSPSPSPSPSPSSSFSSSPVTTSFGDIKGQSLQQRRLTRQRRLRFQNEHDSAGLLLQQQQHSTETCSLPASPLHSFKSAVPQPLPLPDSPLTRRVESTAPYSGPHPFDQQHPVFVFSCVTKTADHDSTRNLRTSSNLGRSSFDPTIASARSDLSVKIPSARVLGGHVSCKDPREHTHDNDSEIISNLKLHFAAKSAPTSILSSPVSSPRRSSNVDLFDPSTNFPHDFNEILKVSPPKAPHSPDRSPRRSPGRGTPYLNLNVQEGSQPHKHSSRVFPEQNAHPLPLPPPKASLPAQPGIVHHHSAETTSPSMKGQWQKGKLIGRGSFGSVYHATNLETGASCAMKEVDLIHDDLKSADCIKQLEQEIKILRQLHHPNIVEYYGSEIVGDHLYIYMEFVHPGSINKFIREHCGAMTESVVRNFTRHILSGLAYLHSTKTIHRDIKGANLLVDASGIVKLADFGVSKILTEKSYELSLKGSPYWMAPELMKAAIKKEFNPDIAMAIDIWSLGCTIIEMLTGKPPWSEFEGPQAMFKVLHKSPPIPETLSSEGQDFLQLCFQRNPADRPSAATLLTHAFVQSLHDQDAFIHSQPCPRGDPGPRSDNNARRRSPRHSAKSSPSPRHSSSKNSPRNSIGARIFSKFHNLMGDTSKKCENEESNHHHRHHHSHHGAFSPESPSPLTEANGRQSPLKPNSNSNTLNNYMSVTNSGNIPFAVMKNIMRHI